ncbi:MAG TPA: hypothetical protein VIE39_09045 [Thermoanaerobaculia bacterium]
MTETEVKPRVLLFVKIYAVTMTVVYFLFAAFLFWLFQAQDAELSLPPNVRMIRYSMVYFCVLLGLAFLVVPFLPRRRWGWGYGLGAIVLGMSSLLLAPFAIPMLLHWIRPATRQYFGLDAAMPPTLV